MNDLHFSKDDSPRAPLSLRPSSLSARLLIYETSVSYVVLSSVIIYRGSEETHTDIRSTPC